jgi:anti-sigma factor RsiW
MSECTNGEMRDLLPELVNGRLSAEVQLAVEAHIAECEECPEELVLLRSLRPALMRGPVVDTSRIAAGVRSQVSSSRARGTISPRAIPWRLAIAAAALIAVSAIGYAIVIRGRNAAPEIAVAHGAKSSTPDSSHERVIAAPAPVVPAPPQRVAFATPHVGAPSTTPRAVTSTGVLDNLSDLSDDDVRTLTASLDGMSGVPDAESAPVIDPLGATLDDQSAGGS